MEGKLLEFKNVTINYKSNHGEITAVKNMSLTLRKGESVGITGESGSGKTSVALAAMRLLDKNARVEGNIYYKGQDIYKLTEKQMNDTVRWCSISMAFQNSLEVLNPALTVQQQIAECIKRHRKLSVRKANYAAVNIIKKLGLESSCSDCYPHQLSGGMRQKVLIGMALSCEPELLIVDEPTSSLDIYSKNEVINFLLKLQKEYKLTMIVISHELDVISKLTSQMEIMYLGHILEEGFTQDIFRNPMHTYTRGLINSSPIINPYADLWGIPGDFTDYKPDSCPFYSRCNQRIETCKNTSPVLQYVSIERKVACNRGGIITLLEAENISKTYRTAKRHVNACRNCSILIKAGEVVALIGESGSGKTTLANILSGVLEADEGEVKFEGKKVIGNTETSRKNGIQIVFQDPFSSINSRFTIEQAVREPLDVLKEGSIEERTAQVQKVLRDVQLPSDSLFLKRRCYALSGGQRQKVALARSMIMNPRLLIADEICSMMDSSTRTNMLRLLKGLQNSKGFAMLYITHDLNIARKIANKVYVMYKGEIVEKGTSNEVFNNPVNSYTKKLIHQNIFYI